MPKKKGSCNARSPMMFEFVQKLFMTIITDL
jgi:hypothetical protein